MLMKNDLYVDAYGIGPKFENQILVSNETFDNLVKEFRDGYLKTKNYLERVIKHRNPIEVRNEILQESYDYCRQIGQRPEMRDVEIKNGVTVHGYVSARVIQAWKDDKYLKSLYNATQYYCEISGKDFNTIAVHVAELRGIEKVGLLIKRDIRRTSQENNQRKFSQPLGTINIVNIEPFMKSFQDYHCGKTHVAQISSKDFEIKQFDTKPLGGFELNPGFPHCCNNHTSLLKLAEEKFQAFPNCCEPHRNLIKAKWFLKDNYAYMPLKFVKTLTYTWHCITSSINNENWFKEITDYIEHTKRSFGQFPDGYGPPLGLDIYLHNLEGNLESTTEIPAEKRNPLLAFVKNYFDTKTEVEQADINLLISKYREWMKIFPFEISFFSELKPYFEKQIPILSGKGETNIYTGLTGFKLTTKRELIGFLANTTLKIIQEINSLHQYNNGLLTDAFEMQRQVIIARRKIEIEELDKASFADRKEYVKLLKKWLAGEKRFLSEIAPLIEKEESVLNFIHNVIDGIRELQSADTNAQCIVNVRNGGKDKETGFRYWFKTFLKGCYREAVISAEEQKGNGRIDLKLTQKPFGVKIVEFKGWWNYSKKKTPEQLCSYLTDFEKEGYIFMINHLPEDILDAYKVLVTHDSMKYVSDSWKEHKVENADISYYESRHKFSVKEKTIYHFIFNVHFSNQLNKK